MTTGQDSQNDSPMMEFSPLKDKMSAKTPELLQTGDSGGMAAAGKRPNELNMSFRNRSDRDRLESLIPELKRKDLQNMLPDERNEVVEYSE